MEHTVEIPPQVEKTALDRWQNAIVEMTTGYGDDPGLDVVFEADHDEIVISRNIEFSSLCEHHLFPFFGKVDVAYIPSKGIVGLSKLARTVDVFSRRLQTQERMTSQIADAIELALKPKAVGVVCRGVHTCQKCRGIKRDGEMITSVMRGVFRECSTARAELLHLLTY